MTTSCAPNWHNRQFSPATGLAEKPSLPISIVSSCNHKSARRQTPRHLPNSASSTNDLTGCGKLKGGNSKFRFLQLPSGQSIFSVTVVCVVHRRCVALVFLKFEIAALMLVNER